MIVRPGFFSGRALVHGLALVILFLLLLAGAAPASAQSEILAWWRRDLLPIGLEKGEWAVYALEEISESRVLRDTLRVQVVGVDSTKRWLEFSVEGEPQREYFLVDPKKFGPEGDVLDGVLRLLRRLPGDQWVEEDLAAYREDRLVRRNLEDPFESPSILRQAAADTVIQGEKRTRQTIRLQEVREERRQLGRSELVIEQRVEAWAQTSPDVPVLGILRSSLRTLVTYRMEPDDGRPSAPPQELLRHLECVGFGKEVGVKTPSFGGL